MTSEAGADLAEFSDCQSGIGWGESDGQVNKETDRIGQHVAELINAWAEGSLN